MSRTDYTTRIDRVLDHVRDRLDETHRLEDLAKVACFSPFHFHRVFQAMTGETVRAFVARARVERAALMLGRAGTKRSLTELALACGYSSSAEFSRAFRARFGTTPSAYRRGELRKNPQEAPEADRYGDHHHASTAAPLRVRVLVAPETRYAYVRVPDPLAPGRLEQGFEDTRRLLAARGIAPDGIVGISHDDPAVTEPALCRYDLGVAVPREFEADTSISVRVVPETVYVEVEVRGDLDAIAATWDRLFAEYLPSSGYEPANGPGVERFLATPDFADGATLHVALLLPIERLRR